jgi:hypothetical protein
MQPLQVEVVVAVSFAIVHFGQKFESLESLD